jgi:hypothetical protein
MCDRGDQDPGIVVMTMVITVVTVVIVVARVWDDRGSEERECSGIEI